MIEYFETDPKINEEWFVRLPKEIELRKATITYITNFVVCLVYFSGSYERTAFYMCTDVQFVERVQPA